MLACQKHTRHQPEFIFQSSNAGKRQFSIFWWAVMFFKATSCINVTNITCATWLMIHISWLNGTDQTATFHLKPGIIVVRILGLAALLPLSSLGWWCSGVRSQTGYWWGCYVSDEARSAAPGPFARSRPPYRPTPGWGTPHGSPHLLPPSCGWSRLVQRPGDTEKEKKNYRLEAIAIYINILEIYGGAALTGYSNFEHQNCWEFVIPILKWH